MTESAGPHEHEPDPDVFDAEAEIEDDGAWAFAWVPCKICGEDFGFRREVNEPV